MSFASKDLGKTDQYSTLLIIGGKNCSRASEFKLTRGGDLRVKGGVDIGLDLCVLGNVFTNRLCADSLLKSNVIIGNILTISNIDAFGNLITITGDTKFNDNLIVCGNLTVNGALELSNTLSVSKIQELVPGEGIQVCGNVMLREQDTLFVSNITSLGNTLTIDSETVCVANLDCVQMIDGTDDPMTPILICNTGDIILKPSSGNLILYNTAEGFDLSKKVLSNILAIEGSLGPPCPLDLRTDSTQKIRVTSGLGIDLMGRALCNVGSIDNSSADSLTVTSNVATFNSNVFTVNSESLICLVAPEIKLQGNVSLENDTLQIANGQVNVNGNVDMNCGYVSNVEVIRANLWLGKSSPFYVGDTMNFINGAVMDIGIDLHNRQLINANNIVSMRFNEALFRPNLIGNVGDILTFNSEGVWSPVVPDTVTLTSAGGTTLVSESVGPDLEILGLSAGTGVSLSSSATAVTITNSSPASSVTLGSAGGTSLVNDGTGPTLSVKGLTAGTNISFSDSGTSITINASSGSTTTLSSSGGTSLVSDGTGPALSIRGLSEGDGTSLVNNGTDIEIRTLTQYAQRELTVNPSWDVPSTETRIQGIGPIIGDEVFIHVGCTIRKEDAGDGIFEMKIYRTSTSSWSTGSPGTQVANKDYILNLGRRVNAHLSAYISSTDGQYLHFVVSAPPTDYVILSSDSQGEYVYMLAQPCDARLAIIPGSSNVT